MIISLKTNLVFIYSIMSSLREEIIQEMTNPRVDKKRLFDLLLKIVDNGGGAGGVGPQGPPGPPGPAGERGPAGPAGKSATTTSTTAKKTTTKKKVETSA